MWRSVSRSWRGHHKEINVWETVRKCKDIWVWCNVNQQANLACNFNPVVIPAHHIPMFVMRPSRPFVLHGGHAKLFLQCPWPTCKSSRLVHLIHTRSTLLWLRLGTEATGLCLGKDCFGSVLAWLQMGCELRSRGVSLWVHLSTQPQSSPLSALSCFGMYISLCHHYIACASGWDVRGHDKSLHNPVHYEVGILWKM